ncbi:TPA: hypothetical protein KOB88_002499 [Clostridioides difficile]|nr:hypothetical protein [Clostridioides difficile]
MSKNIKNDKTNSIVLAEKDGWSMSLELLEESEMEEVLLEEDNGVSLYEKVEKNGVGENKSYKELKNCIDLLKKYRKAKHGNVS